MFNIFVINVTVGILNVLFSWYLHPFTLLLLMNPQVSYISGMEVQCDASFLLNSWRKTAAALWAVHVAVCCIPVDFTACIPHILYWHSQQRFGCKGLSSKTSRASLYLPVEEQLALLPQSFIYGLMQLCTVALCLMCVSPRGLKTVPDSCTLDVHDSTVS